MSNNPLNRPVGTKRIGGGPSTPFAMPVPTPTPAPAPSWGASRSDVLIEQLMHAPARIAQAQAAYDAADAAYKRLLTRLSMVALTAPLFPGKREGDAPRPAANEAERELAIETMAAENQDLIAAAEARAHAVRVLAQERNTFEAAQIIAHLMIANK